MHFNFVYNFSPVYDVDKVYNYNGDINHFHPGNILYFLTEQLIFLRAEKPIKSFSEKLLQDNNVL